MSRPSRRWPKCARISPHTAVGIVLALMTTLVLAIGHRSVGYVRDEGVYFEASRHYATWATQVLEEPGRLLDRKARDDAFEINHEHPALLKLAAGLSARLVATRPPASTVRDDRPTDVPNGGWWPVMEEGAAMRLPAQLLAGIGVALLYCTAATAGGWMAGLLAAGAFILLPRVAFHAGLHCFDVPVAVAVLAVFLVYRRALVDARFAVWLGPVCGLALAIKHNAWFVLPLCTVHYYATLAWHCRRGRLHLPQLLPLPVVSLVVVGPLVAVLLWPWLWHAPVDRLFDYLAFHREHAYYNIEYAGQNHNRPPLPVSYPFVMTWATVPTTLLILGGAGLVAAIWRDVRAARSSSIEPTPRTGREIWFAPLAGCSTRFDGLLGAVFALFPLVLIAWPTVPIFGGTKHWLTAYPFVALAAAQAWVAITAPLRRTATRFAPVALAIVLVPSAWASVHGHPYNLSQYAPLIGGPRGAADAGHCRGFWGTAVLPLLDAVSKEAGESSRRLYLHDLHPLVRKQYRREGRWPARTNTGSPHGSDAGLHFIERHMASDEIELWESLGTRRPSRVITLDDVPLTSLYERSRP